MDILNDVEKAAVQKFVEFETMREAVKKILLFGLYNNGTLKPGTTADPLQNASFGLVSHSPETSNEHLGAHLSAMWEGVRLVENALYNTAEFKKETPREPKLNKSR